MKKTLKYSVFLILIAFISFLFISPNKVVAASTDQYLGQVQLGGDTIGIQIKTKVEIVGKYEIVINDEKIKPWENSDIQEGDYIYSVNDVLIGFARSVDKYFLLSSAKTDAALSLPHKTQPKKFAPPEIPTGSPSCFESFCAIAMASLSSTAITLSTKCLL